MRSTPQTTVSQFQWKCITLFGIAFQIARIVCNLIIISRWLSSSFVAAAATATLAMLLHNSTSSMSTIMQAIQHTHILNPRIPNEVKCMHICVKRHKIHGCCDDAGFLVLWIYSFSLFHCFFHFHFQFTLLQTCKYLCTCQTLPYTHTHTSFLSVCTMRMVWLI